MTNPHDPLMLIQAIRNELRMGTKHYTASGKPIKTPAEILLALKTNDLVFEPSPERRQLFEEVR
jgi:hypothetical protein